MVVDELVEQLAQNNIVIYGTGHVGKKFFWGLKKYGLKENILCFAVSNHMDDEDEIEGIPIRTVEEIGDLEKAIVCVAVHESLKDEIVQILIQRKIKKYMWIYPFLYKLLLGPPIKIDVSVDLDKIMQNYEKDYYIAVHYLAIEQYFGKNNIGFDMYVRAISMHCEKVTAEKRLKKFCELIDNWSKYGVDENCRIFINKQYQIIDGYHRVTVARYFLQQKLMCNIFSDELSIAELHGENVVMTEQVLRDGGFSEEEIRIIDAKNRFIRGE